MARGANRSAVGLWQAMERRIAGQLPRQAVVTRTAASGVWVRFTPVDATTPEMWFPSTVRGLPVGTAGWVHPLAGGKGRFIADNVPLYTQEQVDALIASYRPRSARNTAAPGATYSVAGDYFWTAANIEFTGLVPGAAYAVRCDVAVRTYGLGSFFLLASVPTGGTLASLYQEATHGSQPFYATLYYAASVADGTGQLTVSPGLRWNSGSVTVSDVTLFATVTHA